MIAEELLNMAADVDPEVWEEKIAALGLPSEELDKLDRAMGPLFTPFMAGMITGVTLSECGSC
jgi:hypothetical protein